MASGHFGLAGQSVMSRAEEVHPGDQDSVRSPCMEVPTAQVQRNSTCRATSMNVQVS